MKHIARLAAVAFFALSLAGCAGTLAKVDSFVSSVSSTVSSVAVTPKDVVIAASAYDVVAVTATNYQRLRRCTGSNGPACRDPALRKKIDAAVYAGRAARNNLKAYLRAHPGVTTVKLADYDTLVAATKTLQDATAAYRAAQ